MIARAVSRLHARSEPTVAMRRLRGKGLDVLETVVALHRGISLPEAREQLEAALASQSHA